jgi:hypothetical protein
MQEQFQDIEDRGGDIDESTRVYLADQYALRLECQLDVRHTG